MLLACAAVTELVYVGFYVAGVRLGALAAGGLGLVVATAVCQARLWWWRRRHPILAPQQVMARMRETARWN